MLSFNADLFVSVFAKLNRVSCSLDELIKAWSPGITVPDSLNESFALFTEDLERVQEALNLMGLSLSAIGAERLIESLSSDNGLSKFSHCQRLTNELSQRITDELKGKWAFMIRNDRRVFYYMSGTFCGEDVVKKLSDLKEDAEEAGNCFALGRYTACVFHLMRLMERVVRRLGKKLHVKFNPERDTWQRILKRANDKINALPENLPQQIRRKARFQNLYLDLSAVKDAWRNPTMHPKATYSEEQARQIIDKVQTLVKDFSTLR
jgi:HEPN domain-containing protein